MILLWTVVPSSFQTVDYRVRSPRLQTKLCILGRRPRNVDQEDSDFSGFDSDVDMMEIAVPALLAKSSPSFSPTNDSELLQPASSKSVIDLEDHAFFYYIC